jgi:tetratricopeptide (TPR) repeat protein
MKAMRWTQYMVAVVFLLLMPCHKGVAQTSDSQRLGMALEYFQSGKYHEAMLLLQKLDRKYRLNPRFRAYLGVCYYYEWEYAKATEYLDSVIPQLQSFAPQERSFYYYANAESHFNLRQFDEALPLYTEMLNLCRDNEKPDAYYRIGFIHVYRHEWIDALDNLQSALVYYQRYRPNEKARIAQIKNMINGCCAKIKNSD